MKIQSIGYQHLHGADFCINRPNGSGSCMFLLIHTPAVFYLNGVKQIINKNSYILYTEGVSQQYQTYGSEYMDDWFHFECTEEDMKWLIHIGLPTNQIVEVNNVPELSKTIQNMWYEFYGGENNSEIIINLLFRILILRVSRNLTPGKGKIPSEENRYYNSMLHIRNQIYNEPQNGWSVDQIAKKMSMSRSGIQHLYKKTFGVSIIEDVISGRIARVKYYLQATDDKLEEIAQKCGYKNEAYLMRQFKERCAMTPTEFRKNNNKS